MFGLNDCIFAFMGRLVLVGANVVELDHFAVEADSGFDPFPYVRIAHVGFLIGVGKLQAGSKHDLLVGGYFDGFHRWLYLF
jgi:hypothetical protein